MNFIEIQTWPEVPQIAFFSSLFSRSFNLPEFDIEDLEEALLLDSSENNTVTDNSSVELANPRLISDLIVSLLKGCDLLKKSWPEITASNYQMFLRRVFRHKCEEFNIENPFNTDVDFHSLSLRTKVVILNYLCEFRLDSADVEVLTNNLEADSLRINPLGYDSNDSIYWYFYGTRLYREDIRKSKANNAEHVWQVICFTEDDWHNLANKFKSSKSRKEQNLYKCLVKDFLPSIPYLFKAKEAERRRRLFQRRSSLRVKSLLEQEKLKNPITDEDSTSSEESKFRISFSEKFLHDKKKQLEAKEKIREKIQQDRAIRAQRRRSYESTESSGKSSSNDNIVPLASNQNNSRSNKENIFTKLNSQKLFVSTDNKDDYIGNKMPPVTTKLPGRQTNNSLSSMTGNIMIETPQPPAPPPQIPVPVPTTTSSRKKKMKPESYLETDEVLQIGMHKVLQYVKNHDDAWPFMDPVEEEIAPRYYSIIKRPMDLLKMEEKLDNGEYLTYTDFRTDFKLIVNNCRLYNGQNNEYTQMVNNLQIAFDRATKKYFDQSSSDEEQVLLEYPPVESVNNKVKRKITNSDESISKNDEIKHTKYSKKETVSNSSVSEKKSAKKENEDKVNKKHKNSISKLESSAKNTKRKKEKEKESKSSSKVTVANSDVDDEEEIVSEEEKIEVKSKTKGTNKSKKKTTNNIPVKEVVKASKKYKKKIKAKEKEKTEKKLPKSLNKKAKNNKKIEKSLEADTIVKSEALFKETAYDTDFSSDESIRDLINESFTKTNQNINNNNNNTNSTNNKKGKQKEKKEKVKKAPKESSSTNNKKKGIEKTSKQIKKNKHKISTSKLSLGCLDDEFSMLLGNRDKEKSPALLSIGSHSNDTTSFSDMNKSSSTFEIKDKFDLIKERRNQEKNLLKEKNDVKTPKKIKNQQKSSPTTIPMESMTSNKEKSKEGKKSNKKEVKDLFDELLEDRNESKDVKKPSLNKDLDMSLMNDSNTNSNKKKAKQKATLDVLDLETEQTLKDINKWLEHTPRFEYNSESNSPSRYTIEDMDVHLKSDNNDFRKPIPLMPSSPPSTSSINKKITNSTAIAPTTFQNIIQKNENISKDIDNNNRDKDKDNVLVSANLANKKFAKLSKKKLLGDKHQIVMKKREIQRTTNRLQPGKTKGNLLSNLQNVIKPDEFIPLGNKEKIKEIKNALITETDENSPKLNLGKVLDPSTFNFNNSGLEKDEPISEHKIIDKMSEDENENSEKEQKDVPLIDEDGEISPKSEPECSIPNSTAASATTSSTETNAKPNLSAWFKAFGVSKKPNNTETDTMKKSENKNDNIMSCSIPQRRMSTGSSVSEISSVESSPHVSMEDRSAPAPFPSPIGASPISAISPKLDDINKTNYPDNGPIRVGFYQDTTSTKSSPDKSGSPQEPLSSPYSQHYSQQSNVYSSSQSANVYSNFYNPESSGTSKQHQSSSNSPLYYDQYKPHFNQDSNMHKSMNASVSPGSSHHSQQSSPYQQQPNSPYPPTPDNNLNSEIHSSNNSGSNNSNNMSNIQSPSSTYSQSNSPYHQNPTSPYHSQTLPTNQNFNNQIAPQTNIFDQQQQDVSQFSPNPQPHNASQKAISNNNFNTDLRQTGTTSNAIIHNTPMQHSNFTSHGSSKSNEATMNVVPTPLVQQQQQSQTQNPQQLIYPVDSSFLTNDPAMRNKKVEASNESMFSANTRTDAEIQYQEEVRRQAAAAVSAAAVKPTINERQDNPKYLDLSKQANRFPNQYHAGNFGQPLDLDFSKNRQFETAPTRNVQKGNYPSALNNCQLPVEDSSNTSTQQHKLPSSTSMTASSQIDIPKENPKAPSLSNFIQNPAVIPGNNDLMSAHQSRASQPSAIDMNYKQASLFNSSSASSMMELTAFMRDFRQAEDRFASISNPTTNYYDKTNPAAHMFSSKNAPQSSSAANFQQIYSNPMTTIAYGREQQDFSNYQSRLNIFQATNNTNQMMNANQQVSTPTIDVKGAKKQKKKKNAAAEIVAQQTPSNLSQHQLPVTNQQQAHQQYVHQQTFQSFPGIKVPSGASSDSSSLSIKSVVPGSAFNYGPPTIPGLYGDNSAYLDEFRGTQNPYYSPALRPTESMEKTVPNPPQAHPTTPSNPYHHLLPSHHPSRSYPFMNSIDPAALQQQYRMMFNQSYQAGYLGMHQQPPHWHM